MPTIPLGLRCLKHPLSLAAIGLLLLNDHVLKASVPSTLTGKLSDFAGLFFFPFLLAAVLTLVLRGLQTRPRLAAMLAFGLTGAVFALVKTSPAANALFSEFLAQLYGSPVQVVRDPTDLLALLAFGPALLLWQNEERQGPQPPSKLAYLAIGVAVLASAASSPCYPDSVITRVLSANGRLYITDSNTHIPGIAQSQDLGQTWNRVDPVTLPVSIASQLQKYAQLPVMVCEAGSTQRCYRITGKPQVESTQDGGQTWQVIWETPPGRSRFMEWGVNRFPNSCVSAVNLGPYDLALHETVDGIWLVAASGNQGVLVRNPNGYWQRYAVLNARPTPYTAEDLMYSFAFLWVESLAAISLALGVGTYLAILGWNRIFKNVPDNIRPATRREVLAPAIIVGMLILGISLLILTILLSSPILVDFLQFGLYLILILFLLGIDASWRRSAKLAAYPEGVCQAGTKSGLATMGIFPGAWLFFILWTSGIIPHYEIAVALFTLTSCAILYNAYREVIQYTP